MPEQATNIDELFKTGKQIDDAINKATHEAVKRHHQAQQPMASWQNGNLFGCKPRI